MKNKLKKILRKSYYFLLGLLSSFCFCLNVNAYYTNPYYAFAGTNNNMNQGGISYINAGNSTISKATNYNLAVAIETHTTDEVTLYGFAGVYLGTIENFTTIQVFGSNSVINTDSVNSVFNRVNTTSSCEINQITNLPITFDSAISGANFNKSYTNFSFTCHGNSGYTNYLIVISSLISESLYIYNNFSYVVNTDAVIVNQNDEEMNYNENNIPQPDSSGSDSVITNTDDLLDNFNSVDIDNQVDITIPSGANNFIWSTMTSLLNTNSLVFGLMVSILSIGVIKTALGR